MDIGHWLRSLGLDQYEPAFRENKIDDEVLPMCERMEKSRHGERWSQGRAQDPG